MPDTRHIYLDRSRYLCLDVANQIYLSYGLCFTAKMRDNQLKTKETHDHVRILVEGALKKTGISGRQASLQIVGHDGLIRDIRAGRLPGIDKLAALFNLLGLEFYFGPVRDTSAGPSAPDPDEFAQVPLHEAELSAGSGRENNSEQIIGHLAFRRDWLMRIGVSASNAVLAHAHGESMNPGIFDGDMVLIDKSKTNLPLRPKQRNDRRKSPIYAILQDGQARIKRIEQPESGMLILISDNPNYMPEVLVGNAIESLKIIGKVMWWGHTNRD